MPAPLPNAEAGIAPDTPSLNRRDDIQGLRAVAVLMVVAFHAGLPIPGGFIGVDVFFVISGFVITAMLYRESLQIGRIRFGRFYFRRFKRLTPALALMVSVVVVVSALVLSPIGAQAPVAQTAIGAMFLVANYVIARYSGGYFDTGAEKNPLLHTWSLSVEEQFYLIFPALIALGWHLARRRGLLRFTPVLVVGGVAVASFSLALAGSMGLTFTGSRFVLGFYSPFTRAWEFAAGALLALDFNRGLRARRTMTVLGLIGAALLAASLWLITGTTPFPGVWTLLPVCGTLLLLIAGTSPEAPTTRLLSTLPAVRIGDWS
ncbi:MAG: acyltransferase, partial [Thermoleophilia bacterium]